MCIRDSPETDHFRLLAGRPAGREAVDGAPTKTRRRLQSSKEQVGVVRWSDEQLASSTRRRDDELRLTSTSSEQLASTPTAAPAAPADLDGVSAVDNAAAFLRCEAAYSVDPTRGRGTRIDVTADFSLSLVLHPSTAAVIDLDFQ